jgi:hypothetical protein
VFNEDIPVLEAQQRMLERAPAAPAIDIAVDAAPLAARRMLQALLAQEGESTAVGARGPAVSGSLSDLDGDRRRSG